MHEDFDRCYRAVQSKDARFDGWFVTAVLTTKIYCRPSCPVRPPFARNMRFYPTAAAAQKAGFRACKRCRPDASPGSPEWNVRGDVVARAMRLIADGTVDREGVTGLAARVGYTTRQLERLLQAEVGANPLALARAQRTQTARVLIETTELPFSDVAFAAGFSSIRQFNDTVRTVCDLTPTALRQRARSRFGRGDVRRRERAVAAAAGADAVRLRGVVRPSGGQRGARRRGGARRRLPADAAAAQRQRNRKPHTVTRSCAVRSLMLDDFRDLSTAIARCRRLLDLDADPEAVVDALSADTDLSALVAKAPGQRIPRTVDEQELALRVVLGQQVSLKAARTHARRIVAAYGQPVADVNGGLTHVFPAVEHLAEIDPAHLAFPKSRQRSLITLIGAMADGDVVLDAGCDWNRAREQLLALPGIGPWTAEVIAMRGLGDPDAFPVSDLGVRLAAKQLGLPADPRPLTEHSARWRPWRSYATQHLWTALDHAVNEWPPKEK